MAYSLFLRGTKSEKKIYISITSGNIKVIRPMPFTVDIENWDASDKRMGLSDSPRWREHLARVRITY